MASLFSTLSTGQSALSAASAGIQTTSHNVTNALTEGYSAQSVTTSTADAVNIGGLWLGQGVTTDAITRAGDSILGLRRVEQSGIAMESEAKASALQLVEPWFDESGTDGLSAALTEFYGALTAATTDPSDSGNRAAVVYAAQDLATTFNNVAEGLTAAKSDITESASAYSVDANTMLGEVAALNEAISSGGSGDLVDQRDLLLRSLGETYGMTATIEADGTATVYLGGQAVVSEGEARFVDFSTDSAGSLQIRVAVDSGYINVTDQVGGTVGGLLSAVSEIDSYLATLDDVAVTVSDAYNAQSLIGFDANGNPGVEIFTVSSTGSAAASIAVSSAVLDDPNLLAFAGDITAAAGDGDNLQAMMGLEGTALVGGSTTVSGAISGLKSTVGFDIASAEADAAAAGAVLGDLDDLYTGLYGVNLDEEAVNLITYQAAYEAAAKVINVANEMLQTLMGLV
jgi:flagellar hook-associated protein 1 FlgK